MSNDIRQKLETAAAVLNKAPKIALSSTFHAIESGDAVASSLVTVNWEIDRAARRAHMVIHEIYSHASNVTEYYFDADSQYVQSAGAWRRSALTAASAERLFARGGAFHLLGLQDLAEPAIAAQDNAAGTTLRFRLNAEAVRGAVALDANQVVGDVTLDVDIGAVTKTIDALRVETSASRAGSNVRGKQSIEVRARILSPAFQIRIPPYVTAGALPGGAEELALSNAAANACWCPGCAACAACLACLACLSCIACIFPPALAPVTATASGTAIAAAIAASTAISTGTASAIQSGG